MLTRKRGGQPGNLNALKSGRWSRQKQAERLAKTNAGQREWMAKIPGWRMVRYLDPATGKLGPLEPIRELED